MSINSLYESLKRELDAINASARDCKARITEADTAKARKLASCDNEHQVKMAALATEIEKIKPFVQFAKERLRGAADAPVSSCPPDLGRLHSLFSDMNADHSSMQHAQRLYAEAAGGIAFYENKCKNLSDSLAQSKRRIDDETTVLKRRASDQLNQLSIRVKALTQGPEARELAAQINAVYAAFIDVRAPFPSPFPRQTAPERMYIGYRYRPLQVPALCVAALKALFGDFFEEQSGTLLTPFSFPTSSVASCVVRCSNATEPTAMDGIRALLDNILRWYPAVENRVFFVDAVAGNEFSLGNLKRFSMHEEDFIYPLNNMGLDAGRKIEAALKKLIRLAGRTPAKRFLVIRGGIDRFDGNSKALLEQLCANCESYGVSVFWIYNTDAERASYRGDDFSIALLPDALRLDSRNGAFYFVKSFNDKNAAWRFRWSEPRRNIAAHDADKIKAVYAQKEISNRYVDTFPLKPPVYVRGRRRLELPMGLDEQGDIVSCRPNGDESFAYLLGGTGSGKSVLLNVLITDLIMRYHPDDVELWLADFKLSKEYRDYKKHLPPHVKYLLLDRSPELTRCFLNRLFEAIDQRLRAANKGGSLPDIVVIIDEFPLMSQIIEQEYETKLVLENIIKIGRQAGIHLILAGQHYTTGLRGLSQPAKDNIQSRYAMKHMDRNEIRETLGIAGAAVEKFAHLTDNLPKYHVLTRTVSESGSSGVTKAKVFNLTDSSDPNQPQDLTAQKQWIDEINRSMHPVASRNDADLTSYVEKHPIIIDCDEKEFYSEKLSLIRQEVARFRADRSYNAGDALLFLGSPRNLEAVGGVSILRKSRENLLLFANDRSFAQGAASLVCSVARSSRENGWGIEIWTSAAGRVFTVYADKLRRIIPVYDTLETVCQRIAAVKDEVERGTGADRLIIFLNSAEMIDDARDELDDMKYTAGSAHAKPLVPDVWGNIMNNTPQIAPTAVPAAAPVGRGTAIYDFQQDLHYLLERGPRRGTHILLAFDKPDDMRNLGINANDFGHKLAFDMEKGSGVMLGLKKAEKNDNNGATLSDTFFYTDGTTERTFKPYDHSH